MTKYFKRKIAVRSIKKTFLVICEGQTEKIYFENLKIAERLPNINIEVIKPGHSNPAELVAYAKKEQRDRNLDKVFCVSDGDVLDQSQIRDIIRKAEKKNIQFIVSIPCFELWFLLHFKYVSREFESCQSLIDQELKHHLPDYDKTQGYHKRRLYGLLKERLNEAIGNSRRLEQENKQSGKKKGTSSQVYRIIESLELTKMKSL